MQGDLINKKVRLRCGKIAHTLSFGKTSKNVLIGHFNDKPMCWHESGNWRWDQDHHPLDIVEIL